MASPDNPSSSGATTHASPASMGRKPSSAASSPATPPARPSPRSVSPAPALVSPSAAASPAPSSNPYHGASSVGKDGMETALKGRTPASADANTTVTTDMSVSGGGRDKYVTTWPLEKAELARGRRNSFTETHVLPGQGADGAKTHSMYHTNRKGEQMRIKSDRAKGFKQAFNQSQRDSSGP